MCVEPDAVLVMSVRHALSHVHEELMKQKSRESQSCFNMSPAGCGWLKAIIDVSTAPQKCSGVCGVLWD